VKIHFLFGLPVHIGLGWFCEISVATLEEIINGGIIEIKISNPKSFSI